MLRQELFEKAAAVQANVMIKQALTRHQYHCHIFKIVLKSGGEKTH
jgi:hypothetical protein